MTESSPRGRRASWEATDSRRGWGPRWPIRAAPARRRASCSQASLATGSGRSRPMTPTIQHPSPRGPCGRGLPPRRFALFRPQRIPLCLDGGLVHFRTLTNPRRSLWKDPAHCEGRLGSVVQSFCWEPIRRPAHLCTRAAQPVPSDVRLPHGALWIGDVGGNSSDSHEGINRGSAGPNYGWPNQEGATCYQGGCEGSHFQRSPTHTTILCMLRRSRKDRLRLGR